MEQEIGQLDVVDDADLSADSAEEMVLAGKKKGDDEDGIIAVLIG